MSSRILVGDCREMLRTLEPNSVHVACTSPPYFGLRSYSTNPQVWGGDPNHDPHEWQESVAEVRASGKGGNWQQAENGVGLASGKPQTRFKGDLDAARTPQETTVSRYAFCPCGAWRGELGSEPTPEQFIANLVEVFREVRRVLRPDGTLWLNLGDSYAGSGKGWGGGSLSERRGSFEQMGSGANSHKTAPAGYKAKDLMLMPFRVALALQADGWWLRSAITWCKAAPIPASVTDRPTSATEMVFLLTKSAKYFYDADAVRQPNTPGSLDRHSGPPEAPNNAKYKSEAYADTFGRAHQGDLNHSGGWTNGRNLWNYWVLPPSSYPGAHFATFSPEIPRRAILAGTSQAGCCPSCLAPWTRVVERERGGPSTQQGRIVAGTRLYPGQNVLDPRGDGGIPTGTTGGSDTRGLPSLHSVTTGWTPSCRCAPAEAIPCTVLDPFLGSGTTLMVADRLGRNGVGVELSPTYALMAQYRIEQDAPLFAEVAV